MSIYSTPARRAFFLCGHVMMRTKERVLATPATATSRRLGGYVMMIRTYGKIKASMHTLASSPKCVSIIYLRTATVYMDGGAQLYIWRRIIELERRAPSLYVCFAVELEFRYGEATISFVEQYLSFTSNFQVFEVRLNK